MYFYRMTNLDIKELRDLRNSLVTLKNKHQDRFIADAIIKLDKVISRMDAVRKRLI